MAIQNCSSNILRQRSLLVAPLRTILDIFFRVLLEFGILSQSIDQMYKTKSRFVIIPMSLYIPLLQAFGVT